MQPKPVRRSRARTPVVGATGAQPAIQTARGQRHVSDVSAGRCFFSMLLSPAGAPLPFSAEHGAVIAVLENILTTLSRTPAPSHHPKKASVDLLAPIDSAPSFTTPKS